MVNQINDTLPKILRANFEKFGNSKVAMRRKKFGLWNEYTWQDYYDNVKMLCLGLMSLGLKRGDRVSIIGDNSPEWIWAELATLSAGGMAIGIYSDAIPSELKYILEHSESKFVIASDQEQVDKLLLLKPELPELELKKVIWYQRPGTSK